MSENPSASFTGNLASVVICLELIVVAIKPVQQNIKLTIGYIEDLGATKLSLVVVGGSFHSILKSKSMEQLKHLLSGFGMELELTNDRTAMISSSVYLDDSLKSLNYRYAS